VRLTAGKPQSDTCLPPHRCLNGTSEELGPGRACSCPEPACSSCSLTADGAVCEVCDATRFLADGSCVKNIMCRGTKVLRKGVVVPGKCSCKSVHRQCQQCTISKDGTSDTYACLGCRMTFFHQGQCTDTCPTGMAEYGMHSDFGRMCLQPFLCMGRKVRDGPADRNGRKCRCPDKNCHVCPFAGDGASRQGAVCEKCRAKQYLHEGRCVAECPAGEGLVPFGSKQYGRQCRQPFTCTRGKDDQGEACECPARCDTCRWNQEGAAVCTECAKGYLVAGECLKTCPTDRVAEDGTCIVDKEGGTSTTATTTPTTTATATTTTVTTATTTTPTEPGTTVEPLPTKCSQTTCENGECQQATENTVVCVCAAGFSGARCEVEIDYCQPNPCANGTCTAGLSASFTMFTCACHAGFTGPLCQHASKACLSNPCLNGAACVEREDAAGAEFFVCECTPGYQGSDCGEAVSQRLVGNQCCLAVLLSQHPHVCVAAPGSCTVPQ